MALQGIGQYSPSYTAAYRKSPADVGNAEAVRPVVAQPEVSEESGASARELQEDDLGSVASYQQAPRTSNPADFPFDFHRKNDYQLVAATSDTEDMDVNKALQDMERDTVLDQYKYFVKPTNLGTDEDGTVRLVQR